MKARPGCRAKCRLAPLSAVALFLGFVTFGFATPAFASNGTTVTIANQTMDGKISFPPGSWVAAGYQFSTHGTAAVTFSQAQVTLPVACEQGNKPVIGTIVVQLTTGPYTPNGTNYTPWLNENSTSPLSYQGAVQAPDICSGGSMYSNNNSGGASFSANVESIDPSSVSIRFHYAVPASAGHGQTNTDCNDASSPGATNPSVCGTPLSSTGNVTPSTGNLVNVVPAVTCVTPGVGTQYTAYFGYSNAGAAFTYPQGSSNTMTPSTLNGAEPTSFISGTVANAFNVAVTSGSATWTVAGQSATATISSTVCTGSSLPVDPLGLSLIVVIGAGVIIGVLMVRRTAKGRRTV